LRLRRVILDEGITAVHAARCLHEGWAAWLLKRLCGTPYLLYVHGEDIEAAATSRELAWMTRRVIAGARLLIANSEHSAKLLREKWGQSEKVRVLHPGVDLIRFRPAARDEAARAELGWAGRKVVLTVGRLQRRKGHDMMIRALPAIRRAVPEVLYAIAGDGRERATLQALAEESGVSDAVQFLGEPGDEALVKAYRQCDLFALPNRRIGPDVEGFGMVLVEAQACGRPVLAGDSGGTAETMRPGATGVIADCTAPEPVAKAVADLLGDPSRLEEMGSAGRRHVEARFDWNRLAEDAAGLFSEVGTHRPPLPPTALGASIAATRGGP